MSNIRASGYQMKDRDDDESFQMLVGDVERLTIALRKGADIGPNGTTVGGSATTQGALLAVNNLSDVQDAATARINLGITTSGGGSLFLQVSNNLSDLNNAATARANLGLGTIATLNTVGTAQIDANAVADGNLRDSGPRSVIGRAANSTGDPADITASSDGSILRLNGTVLGFGSINLASSGAVGVSKLPIANGGTGESQGTDAVYALTGFKTPASIVATTTYTSGSGTHTTNASARYMLVIVVGGGGGGGRGQTGTGAGAGGGGGAGAIAFSLWRTFGSTGYSYSVGAGGAAASSAGADGTAGGGSTFRATTAGGGGAGRGTTNSSHGGRGGEISPAASTIDGIIIGAPGNDGQPGRLLSLTVDGGGNVTGTTPAAGSGGSAGHATGYGAGGAGGTTVATAGSDGAVIVYEYT